MTKLTGALTSIILAVAIYLSLALTPLDAHARTPETSFSNSSQSSSSFSNSRRFTERAAIKGILLNHLLRNTWNNRYSDGRVRLHRLPSGFPQKGRLRVNSMAWDHKSKRFFAQIIVRAVNSLGSQTPEQSFSISGEAVAYTKVVATRRPLLPGMTLTADDLEIRSMPISNSLKGALENLEDAIGKEIRFRLRTNSVLRMYHLRLARMVRRNSTIDVDYSNGGVRVILQARALENGAKGDSIRLRNNISGNEFQAIVTGAGRAAVLEQPVINLARENRQNSRQKIGDDDNPFRKTSNR